MKHTDKSSPNVKRHYRKSELTPAKKQFAHVYAKTDNATEAVRQAYPELAAHTSDEVLRNKGHRLLTNANVSDEIAYQKNKLELLATKAVNRLDKLIDSDDEDVATRNIWKTIEQVQGKATQRTENVSVSLQFGMDLSTHTTEVESHNE